jgi:hypothetical protein
MIRVFKQRYFNLYSDMNNGYIIHNTHKPFDNGHTHLNNYDTARYLIKLAYHHIVPKHLSVYLIDSLIRISNDEDYIRKLNILKQKELKGQKTKGRHRT